MFKSKKLEITLDILLVKVLDLLKTPTQFQLNPYRREDTSWYPLQTRNQTDKQTDNQTYTQTDMQTDMQTDKPTDIHTDRQTGIKTDKQTGNQTSHSHSFLIISNITRNNVCTKISGISKCVGIREWNPADLKLAVFSDCGIWKSMTVAPITGTKYRKSEIFRFHNLFIHLIFFLWIFLEPAFYLFIVTYL